MDGHRFRSAQRLTDAPSLRPGLTDALGLWPELTAGLSA